METKVLERMRLLGRHDRRKRRHIPAIHMPHRRQPTVTEKVQAAMRARRGG